MSSEKVLELQHFLKTDDIKRNLNNNFGIGIFYLLLISMIFNNFNKQYLVTFYIPTIFLIFLSATLLSILPFPYLSFIFPLSLIFFNFLLLF